eukprot:2910167-Pyramimonas_sp.AAC.1
MQACQDITARAPEAYQKVPAETGIGPRVAPPCYSDLEGKLRDFLEHRLDGNGMGTMIWGHTREMGVTILEEVFLEW